MILNKDTFIRIFLGIFNFTQSNLFVSCLKIKINYLDIYLKKIPIYNNYIFIIYL